MQVLEVLGRRWALRVLWELRNGPQTFRALRDACDDVSPSSLNQRLAELRDLGAVVAGEHGYQLTPSGVRLSKVVLALHGWAETQLPARAAAVVGATKITRAPRRVPARRRG